MNRWKPNANIGIHGGWEKVVAGIHFRVIKEHVYNDLTYKFKDTWRWWADIAGKKHMDSQEEAKGEADNLVAALLLGKAIMQSVSNPSIAPEEFVADLSRVMQSMSEFAWNTDTKDTIEDFENSIREGLLDKRENQS